MFFMSRSVPEPTQIRFYYVAVKEQSIFLQTNSYFNRASRIRAFSACNCLVSIVATAPVSKDILPVVSSFIEVSSVVNADTFSLSCSSSSCKVSA